jgi:hypothetical protein
MEYPEGISGIQTLFHQNFLVKNWLENAFWEYTIIQKVEHPHPCQNLSSPDWNVH